MIERDLKHYLLTVSPICEVVDKHIYAGRIPKTAEPEHAILLRRISGTRTYGLFGEDDVAQPIVQIDLLSRHAAAETILNRLFENCRKALNKFAGAPGKMGSTWVLTMQIISETVDVPQVPVANSLSWKRQRSFDVQFMHQQETSLA
jgi:hypothetical protein